jgi:hypothetical protein
MAVCFVGKGRILSAAGRTPTYVLPGFTLASELLAAVGRLLPAGERENQREG